jgi:PPOX class probable F420-dependent enzyme
MDNGLATVSTLRANGAIQVTVVHAGIVTHPVRGSDVGAFVAHGGTQKLTNLRARPQATLLWRAGWAWVAVEGTAELCGPDDALPGVDAEEARQLLREIARAAGSVSADWDEFDRLMLADRRAAVLVTPQRVYQNP